MLSSGPALTRGLGQDSKSLLGPAPACASSLEPSLPVPMCPSQRAMKCTAGCEEHSHMPAVHTNTPFIVWRQNNHSLGKSQAPCKNKYSHFQARGLVSRVLLASSTGCGGADGTSCSDTTGSSGGGVKSHQVQRKRQPSSHVPWSMVTEWELGVSTGGPNLLPSAQKKAQQTEERCASQLWPCCGQH